MADLILSPVVHLVKQQVVACLKHQYKLRSGVEGKLKNLEATLNQIEAVANTADELDLEKHKALEAWAKRLKVASEEAIDVLDELEYLGRRRQAESFAKLGLSALPKKFKTFFQSTNSLEKLSNIQSKFVGLASNTGLFLQVVADLKAAAREHQSLDGPKRETSSSVVERLVGRTEKLEEIIKKLLGEEEEQVSNGAVFPVLAMVGHGGMGKTSLAQHVFQDTRVETHFQVRMWVYVSQDFLALTLTRKMIESAAPKEKCSHIKTLDALQQTLEPVLKSKRFLLVLDDVWYDQKKKVEMQQQWKTLCSHLAKVGRKGSKILLTSRTPEVEALPGVLAPSIYLQELTQDECWSIMQTSIFPGSVIPHYDRNLVELGKQIALKVSGSPLAAKAVGMILREDTSIKHWSTILKKEISDLPVNDVMAVLRLSYEYLPPHLRQCFAYCSLFPKGHHFDVDMLVRMWVAHGYIGRQANGETTEEEVGMKYFVDLLSAGFFTRQFDEYAVMNDLMHDLARFVSKDKCLLIEHTLPQDGSIPDTVRHLSIRTDHLAELSKKVCDLGNLHTLLLFDNGSRYDELDKMLVKQVLLKLRRVRVLDLHGCNLKELPDDISGWEHLRYLDLSYTNVARLPYLICTLYHLQVLDLRLTSESWPEKFNNLVNLRFLGPDNFVTLFCLRGLKFIQVLRGAIYVEKGDESEMETLKDLNELGETLVLDNLDQVKGRIAAMEANLCSKKKLQQLHLKWKICSADESHAVEEVLEGLQPPSTLERLEIYNYAGTVCPNWMINPSLLANLASICLKNLQGLECLPPLGMLPFLRSVKLKSLPKVRELSQEGFPSLKILMIEHMNELEEWRGADSNAAGLPCLEKLTITNCRKMRALPTLPPTLTDLRIEDVGSEVQELPRRINDVIRPPASLKKLKIKGCPARLFLDPDRGRLTRKKCIPRRLWIAVASLEIDEPLMLIEVPFLKSLTSVRELNITNASKLISFSPELEAWLLQNGTSLRTLEINNARKLRSLPNLPNSLEELNIGNTCPKFMKKYERVTGPAWHKIRNIKHIDIS